MRLTVIGCSPAWPNPGSAHSGYMIESPGGRLLVDCGPGILGKLRVREDGWPRVDAILVSHWHLDHWGDLVPWVWGSKFGLGRGQGRPELWGPPGATETLRDFGERFGTPAMFTEVFQLHEYAEGESFQAAGLTVTAIEVPHYTIPTYAFRMQEGDRTLTYSGDSAPSDALVEAARGADLFLCEATLASGEADNEPRGHLAADEAIAAFEASGAKRLVLTHHPQELPLPDGVEFAYEGLELEL
jgi:ribonuclease BN (tRNA processing enzyme)